MSTDPSASHWTSRPGSSSVLRISVVVVAICVVGAVLTQLRSVVTPLLTGLLLLFLINPLVSKLDARHVPRWLTYLLLFVIGTLTVVGIGQLIQTQATELTDKLPEYQKRSSAALDKYAQSFGIANKDGHFDGGSYGLQEALPVNRDQLVSQVAKGGMEVLELCTMALFYLLFGLAESKRFSERMERSLSDESASEIGSIIVSIQKDIWRYLRTKTVISIGLGLTTAILGWGFHLDFWLLWGFLMFLANYVTYIGSIVATIPPILVAFVQFDNLTAAAGFAALLVIARVIWIDYAEMRFSGKQVNVSPVLVLFSVALMGWMWGAVGMLLAVPLLTVARVILGSFPKTRFVASLISDMSE